MTANTPDPTGTPNRRWVPWAAVAAVAVVAIIVAVIVVPLLRPTAALTPSPTATQDSPTPTPTPTATCTVTTNDVTWIDPWAFDLPADGSWTSTSVTILQDTPIGEAPYILPFMIDDETFGVVTQYGAPGAQRAQVTVIDRATSEVRWSAAFDGYADVLSTPATTGVAGLFLSVNAEGGFRMLSIDLATGQVLRERATGETYTVERSPGRGSRAVIAETDAEAFFVSDRDALSRIDPDTLEAQWTVRGEDFGVDWFEGGVPFRVVGEVAFVGEHAIDARTGEALGWKSAGDAVEGAGAVLQLPRMYDYAGPYTLSGLDTTSGESCWSIEVTDFAATNASLWVLTPDGSVDRIDPLTGETLLTVTQTGGSAGTGLEAYGDLLAVVTSDPDDYAVASTYRIFDGSTDVGVLSGTPLPSGDQLLVLDRGTVDTPATLTAYALPGATIAWQRDAEGVEADAGVLLRPVWSEADRRFGIDVLR